MNVADLFTSNSFQRSATQFRRVFKFSPVKDQRQKNNRKDVFIPCRGHTETRYFHFLRLFFSFEYYIQKEKQEKKNHKNLNTAQKTLIFLTVGINIETDAACITGHQNDPINKRKLTLRISVFLPCARPFCD